MSTPGRPAVPERDTGRLSPRGLAVRLALGGAVLLALLYGTVFGADKDFPFGPMVQYAFYVDPDGSIDDTYLLATTADGRQLTVDPRVDSIGVNRAQIEGQLDQIRARPALMARFAANNARNRPREPRWVALSLRQHVRLLHDGRITGTQERTVADWHA